MENPTNITKKLIYLDQNIISNITKSLDPAFPRREQILKNQPFWLEIYKKLDRLLKLQLIVCPDSLYHRNESLVCVKPSFDSLQNVYTYLSNGCTFQDELMILRWQLLHYFRDYLDGHTEHEPVIPASDVVFGSLDEWHDRFRVAIPYKPNLEEVKRVRIQREERHKRLETAFALWQQKSISYNLAKEEEARSLGQSIMQSFFSYQAKWMDYHLGLKRFKSPLDLLPPPGSSIIFDLIRILEEHNVTDPMKHLYKIREYFQSPYILRVPYIRLSSMLYAAIARKAPHMESSPDRGTITDVNVVASFLPYCDALFVDNRTAGYLREPPLREEVARFGAQIFSPKSKSVFMAYLNEIESRAGQQHERFVERIYGRKLLTEPFMSVVVTGNKWREE